MKHFLLRLCALWCAVLIPVSWGGSMLLNPYRFTTASGTDSDAQDYFDRIVTNGGTISGPAQTAVNTFVVAAKANGYWTKLVRINVFAGDFNAALTPLKVGSGGVDPEANTGFVSGDYSLATGLTGNGTSKILDTGILANSLTANNTHLAVYNRSSTAAISGMGATTNDTTRLQLHEPYSDGNVYSDQYGTAGGRVSAAVTGAVGFLIASRTSSALHTVYRNGSSIGSNTSSEGTLPALSMFVFGINNDNVPGTFSPYSYGAYSIGAGLTSGEAASYNTDMETLMDSLGRGVQ